ncbi:MAG TPA: protoglobin domain-containing protein [Polyangia bacterium]|nr:protoglobin domain-containing protein [Polyangia bacterium]
MERDQPSVAQTLMHEMGLDSGAIERRKRVVALEPDDLTRIAAVKHLVVEDAEGHTAAFFNHFANLDEARGLLSSKALLERARQLQKQHLRALVSGVYDLGYIEQRIEYAAVFASAGLEPRVFLGAFHMLLRSVGTSIMKRFEGSPTDAFESFMSLKKAAFFDIGVVNDVLVFERERLIRQQQESIRELSTPVLQVRERLLLLPIIGVIDTQRARFITESVLRSIRANRAKVVVMDITGVATIDSKVANHILQTVTAARLMGTQVIVTGLSPEVAQSLVALGIELSKLRTVGDLQGGLEEAEDILGYRMVARDGARPVAAAPALD